LFIIKAGKQKERIMSKLKELLAGLTRVKELAAETKKAYQTIRELRGLTDTMPECDARTNIVIQIELLEVEAALNELAVHNKTEKLVALQEEILKEHKLFIRYEGEAEEFREKMLEVNPEYYYHESLGNSI
jgi:hypothetical protein